MPEVAAATGVRATNSKVKAGSRRSAFTSSSISTSVAATAE